MKDPGLACPSVESCRHSARRNSKNYNKQQRKDVRAPTWMVLGAENVIGSEPKPHSIFKIVVRSGLSDVSTHLDGVGG